MGEALVAAQGEPEDQDRREQILSAALRVFADRGYKAATIKRIADEAGLKSGALLYWYFANKEELFAGVLLRYATVLGDDPIDRDSFELPPRDFLGAAMRNWLARFEDPNTLLAYRLLILEVPLLREHGFRLDDKRPANLFVLLEDYLAHQVELGRLRSHDTRHAARSVVALLSLQVQSRYSAVLAPLPDDESFIEASLDLVLEGLSPR